GQGWSKDGLAGEGREGMKFWKKHTYRAIKMLTEACSV
ncbi:hypothetical protein S1OALGB6SA_1662, partial [Olavius algarvensis spirochete endosymbiont]